MNKTLLIALDRYCRLRSVLLLLAFFLTVAAAPAARQPGKERAIFTNSITPMPPRVAATVRPLRREHLGKTMEIEIPLQMRDYPKLLEKIGHGAVVSHEEMERDHLPLIADYKAVLNWLRREGFAITQTDPNRLTVFAQGSVAQIQEALQVDLVQVTANGLDYEAARSHPSLPQEIAKPVLGINGLQPFLQLRKHALQPAPNIADKPPYVVKEILGAYDAQNLGVSGSNQKIAILIDTVPADNDLTNFWSYNNIPQSLSNIEKVNVTGATLPAPSGEETLDVEWSSAIAPAAKVRIYASASLSFTNLDKALQRIISDLPNQPQMHQLSISLGLGESYLLSSSQMKTDAQFFASIASSGVSIFVSSGDAGSNPDSTGQSSSGPLQVEYYASDPSVTGVGGTNLSLNTSTGAVSSETGWDGSGGGISQYFTRPSWQTGTGVVAGTRRLVPDVSLVASDTTYAYFYFGGKGSGVAGTSWSAPTWAGFCALLNEARANASQAPIGLLNPHIYPLLGTANFRDIISGNNGQYNAGTGYDMVTGLGVPSVSTLIQSLGGAGSGSPTISSFSPTSGAINATVTISGANLGRVTTVTFNGVSAAFTVDSSTQITATVPNGATTGPIVVTASPGGSATSAINFTVISGAVANDNFANATSISGTSGSATGSNVGATKETGEPNHAGNAGGASVWYTWTAPKGGTYTVDTFGSSFDTLLAIYTGGSVSSLTQVAANDDAGTGVTSSVSFVATAGTVYRIAVDGHDGQTGSLNLHWKLNTAAPVINSFTPASGSPGTVVAIDGANFTGATSVKFNGTSASFTVASSTQITATVPAGATTGVVSLATASGTANSAAVFTVLNPPDNDNFANAQVITGASGTLTGENIAATKEAGEPNHAGNSGGASVWYKWTAPNNSTYSFNTFGSSFDTLLAVYSGANVSSLTQVAANDDTGGGVASSVSFRAAAGTVYFIAVDGNSGATGNLTLSWSSNDSPPIINSFTPANGPAGSTVTISGSSFTGATGVSFNGVAASYIVNSDSQITATVPSGTASGLISVSNLNGSGASSSAFTITSAPINDNFVDRLTISGSGATVNASNVGATKELGEPNPAGSSGGKSVWWTWMAPASGQYVISTLGSNFDTVLGVYTGNSVSSLSVVASNDDDPNGGVTSSVKFTATAGTAYQIAVDGVNGASGNIVLTVAPGFGTSPLFSTGFESAEGYTTGTDLAGQPASAPSSQQWHIQGVNGNGVLNGYFSGQRQAAYIGYSRQYSSATGSYNMDPTYLWRPINFTPSPGDVVTFSVSMAIEDSTNRRYDDFQWQVYNSSAHLLFALDFDNYSLEIGYYLGDNSYHSTGVSFTNGTKYNLQVTLDFGSGTWSATLNGSPLIANQPISNSSPAATMDLGDIDPVWDGSVYNNYYVRGNNYMVFDNYSITKTSLMAPQIVLQPQSQTARVGDNVNFTVAALGSQPLSYQWQNGGVNIKGATSATLTLNSVQATDAGNYSVNITNLAGTVRSDSAKLTVNTPPPSYTIATSSSPSNEGTTSGGGLFLSGTTVTVRATANTGYAFVNWTENGNVVSTSPNYSFPVSANRSLVANFQLAQYTISTSASPANSGTITGGGNYTFMTIASLSAAPSQGYQFSNWTENGNVVSSSTNYSFVVTGARSLTANFVSDSIPPTVSISSPTTNATFTTISGTLFLRGSAFDNFAVTRVAWANDRGGSGDATGTSSWTTGGIPLQPGTNLFTITAYDAAGNAGTATLTVVYTPPVNFSLFSGAYNGLLGTTEITGTSVSYIGLTKMTVNSKGSFTASIYFKNVRSVLNGKFAIDGTYSGKIARYNRTPLAVAMKADASNLQVITGTVGDGILSGTLTADRAVFNAKTNPCPYAGRYTMVMRGNQDPGTPQGQGIGSITVSTGGALQLSGVFADGSSLSHSATVSKDGLWPFYAPMYGNGGYVAGPQNFGSNEINGVLDWIKPANLNDAYFPNRFETRLALYGSWYQAPAVGETVVKPGPRTVTLQDPSLQLTKSVALNPPSKFTILNPDTDRLSLSLTLSTGRISGKFLSSPTAKSWTTLRAVILQGQDEACGFFLENHQSGDFEMTTAP